MILWKQFSMFSMQISKIASSISHSNVVLPFIWSIQHTFQSKISQDKVIPEISKIFSLKVMIEIGLLNEWYTDIAVQNSWEKLSLKVYVLRVINFTHSNLRKLVFSGAWHIYFHFLQFFGSWNSKIRKMLLPASKALLYRGAISCQIFRKKFF